MLCNSSLHCWPLCPGTHQWARELDALGNQSLLDAHVSNIQDACSKHKERQRP
jgi:hypothetical protein